MTKPVVVIATPCFGGMLSQDYMLSVMRMMTSIGNQLELSILLLGNDAMITRSRSTLVGKFLDNPAATHLLFIDSDIAFEPEQFARLFRLNKDFTAASYPIKEFDWDLLPVRHARGETFLSAGLNYVGTLNPPHELKVVNEFATARYVGAGFQLIRRSVFERLISAYPELKYSKIHSKTASAPAPGNLYALFDPIIDEQSGEYLSEDYAFCKRWRDIGGEIWLDLKSKLTHIGPNDYRGDSAERYKSFLKETLY